MLGIEREEMERTISVDQGDPNYVENGDKSEDDGADATKHEQKNGKAKTRVHGGGY